MVYIVNPAKKKGKHLEGQVKLERILNRLRACFSLVYSNLMVCRYNAFRELQTAKIEANHRYPYSTCLNVS
jgi:hypothetical protein